MAEVARLRGWKRCVAVATDKRLTKLHVALPRASQVSLGSTWTTHGHGLRVAADALITRRYRPSRCRPAKRCVKSGTSSIRSRRPRGFGSRSPARSVIVHTSLALLARRRVSARATVQLVARARAVLLRSRRVVGARATRGSRTTGRGSRVALGCPALHRVCGPRPDLVPDRRRHRDRLASIIDCGLNWFPTFGKAGGLIADTTGLPADYVVDDARRSSTAIVLNFLWTSKPITDRLGRSRGLRERSLAFNLFSRGVLHRDAVPRGRDARARARGRSSLLGERRWSCRRCSSAPLDGAAPDLGRLRSRLRLRAPLRRMATAGAPARALVEAALTTPLAFWGQLALMLALKLTVGDARATCAARGRSAATAATSIRSRSSRSGSSTSTGSPASTSTALCSSA